MLKHKILSTRLNSEMECGGKESFLRLLFACDNAENTVWDTGSRKLLSAKMIIFLRWDTCGYVTDFAPQPGEAQLRGFPP